MRIAAGEARLVIGCDMIVAASDEAIAKMQAGSTRAVINGDVAPTGGFTKDPDLQVPAQEMADAIREACGQSAADFVDATDLATALLGDSIATNLVHGGLRVAEGPHPARRGGDRAGDRAERRRGRNRTRRRSNGAAARPSTCRRRARRHAAGSAARKPAPVASRSTR